MSVEEDILPVKVLVVEDDEGVGRFLHQVISEEGWEARWEEDGAMALRLLTEEPFDLVLLDVMLPGKDGVEVCRELRARSNNVPVLMITARDALEDKIAGLDAGADDYLCKPFQMAELLARARALLRRSSDSQSHLLEVKDLSLDPLTRQAVRGGNLIRLSGTEYRLLSFMMRNAGKVLARQQILEHVWQYDFGGNDNVLDVYVSYLRSKIDKGYEPLIHTVRAVGFRMGDPVEEPEPSKV
jgi:DNA-binding response OmpR family regulator